MSSVFDKKILVVDDMESIVRIIKKLLEEIGFKHVDTTKDAHEALEMYNSGDYALIISDWNMPGMTGLELLKKVRAKDPGIPFIMITAESKTTNVLAARAEGVTNYIKKPFNLVTLKEKLSKVFGPL